MWPTRYINRNCSTRFNGSANCWVGTHHATLFYINAHFVLHRHNEVVRGRLQQLCCSIGSLTFNAWHRYLPSTTRHHNFHCRTRRHFCISTRVLRNNLVRRNSGVVTHFRNSELQTLRQQQRRCVFHRQPLNSRHCNRRFFGVIRNSDVVALTHHHIGQWVLPVHHIVAHAVFGNRVRNRVEAQVEQHFARIRQREVHHVRQFHIARRVTTRERTEQCKSTTEQCNNSNERSNDVQASLARWFIVVRWKIRATSCAAATSCRHHLCATNTCTHNGHGLRCCRIASGVVRSAASWGLCHHRGGTSNTAAQCFNECTHIGAFAETTQVVAHRIGTLVTHRSIFC